jgi:hypothetical protein
MEPKSGLTSFLSAPPHLHCPLAIAEHAAKHLGQRHRIASGHQVPGPSVVDDFAAPSNGTAHDGLAQGVLSTYRKQAK